MRLRGGYLGSRFGGRLKPLAGQTVASGKKRLLWGGTKGEAQSERVKRGPRQSDETAESSTRRSGVVTRPNRPRRRLGSGQQDRGGIGANRGTLPGLVIPMPSAQALTNQQTHEARNVASLVPNGSRIIPRNVGTIDNISRAVQNDPRRSPAEVWHGRLRAGDYQRFRDPRR